MTLLIALTLFVLAVFLGMELISKVPATLHTPLMSGSNAVSGITLIGALVSAGTDHSTLTTVLGFVAVVLLRELGLARGVGMDQGRHESVHLGVV